MGKVSQIGAFERVWTGWLVYLSGQSVTKRGAPCLHGPLSHKLRTTKACYTTFLPISTFSKEHIGNSIHTACAGSLLIFVRLWEMGVQSNEEDNVFAF